MLLSVEHVTRYRWAESASYSIQSLRLTPPRFEGQEVVEWRITSTPESELTPATDGFGNAMHLMAVTSPHDTLEIRAGGIVATQNKCGIVRGLPEMVPLRAYLKHTPLTAPASSLVELSRVVEERDRIAWLHATMDLVRDRVDYLPGATTAETTAADALAAGKGVCQDHAHILIAAARAKGMPARYVTGYLLTDAATAEAHHAWAEVWVEGLGWVGFDVANRMCPTDAYVRLASALDAHYAAPIRGSRRGGRAETLSVEVTVVDKSPQPEPAQVQSQDGKAQQQALGGMTQSQGSQQEVLQHAQGGNLAQQQQQSGRANARKDA